MRLNVNITAKLLGYLLLAGMVPVMVLGFFSWETARRVVLAQAQSGNAHMAGSFASYLALYDDAIEDLATNIASNEAVGVALRAADAASGSSFDQLNVRVQIGYTLNSYVRVKGLVSLDLFSVGGLHFHVGETLGKVAISNTLADELLREVRSKPDTVIWQGIGPNINAESRFPNVRTVARAVRHFDAASGTTDLVGVLVISLSDDIMQEFLQRSPLPPGQQLMLVDQDNLIAMHSDRSWLGKSLSPALGSLVRDGGMTRSLVLDGEPVLIDSTYMALSASHVVMITPRSLVTAGVDQLTLMALGVLALCLAGVAALTWRYERTVVRPIRDVAIGFRLLREQHDMDHARLQVPASRDEIGLLVDGYNGHLEILHAQKKANAELVLARSAAEEASRAKSDFLANMSHEIRTPMNAILGMLELMRGTALDAKQTDYVAKTEGAAKSLLGLLNDILDFSKVEAGKMVLDPRPFSVQKLLDGLAVVLSANSLGKGIEVRFELDPHAPAYVRGDDLRLMQILVNLGGNAIKFTNEGEVVVRVKSLGSGRNHASLEFSVIDTGIGISADQQRHIFESFSQAESSTTRRFGGSGLGLTISRRLVELMGGTLSVESSMGKGSRFYFAVDFPLVREDEASALAQAKPAVATSTSAKRLQGMRILLVEDNKINQMVAENLLAREGALVMVADNGQLALEALKAAQPGFQAVLMDLQMPVMDGFEATRAIRQQPVFAQLPIIAMTANAMASDREACLDVGMNDHVGKPFELNHLVAVLLQHVYGRAAPLTEVSRGVGTAAVGSEPALASAPAADGASSAPQGDSVAQLDMPGALARMGGVAELLASAQSSFMQEAQPLGNSLQDLWSQGQLEQMVRLLHTLKGLAGTVGAIGLSKALASWEKQAKAGLSPEGFAPWLQDVQSGVAQGLAALTRARDALGVPQQAQVSERVLDDVDREGALAQLQGLEDLLRNSDLAALEVLQAFQAGPGASLGESSKELVQAVQRLDFDAALAACIALRERLASGA